VEESGAEGLLEALNGGRERGLGKVRVASRLRERAVLDDEDHVSQFIEHRCGATSSISIIYNIIKNNPLD
jgi:hypothetical protein